MFKFFLLILATLGITLSQSDYDYSTEEVQTGYTATDCLSYIYVAWIIFIYSVGLGVQTDQFSQVN